MDDIRELSIAELDSVSGGMDPNYKECPTGTTTGGGPGVYPNSVECNGPNPFSLFRTAAQQIIQAAQHGGRPA